MGVTPEPESGFGVYLHIPFCKSRCDYCAFATFTDRHDLRTAYLDACLADIERSVARGLRRATTVFVGGGTPTQVDPEHLGRVLDAIPMTDDAEVTVECNPDDVSEDLLRAYRNHRVNRVSVGVQSMVDEVLQSLGDDVIIVPALSDEEAKAKFPKGWNALKPYLRITQQPNK